MKTWIVILLLFFAGVAHAQQSNLAGTYQFDMSPLRIFSVKADQNSIYFSENGKDYLDLSPLGENRYRVAKVKPEAVLRFMPDKMIINQGGKDYSCQKISDEPDFPKASRVPNRQNGFTRADTLRGKLSAFRDCYEVTYYHLTVELFPEHRSLSGNTLIRFNAVKSFKELQVDLYEHMRVDSIVYDGRRLNYSREYDAVFVQFPALVAKGTSAELRVYYHGRPQTPDLSVSMNGGVAWRKDARGKPFLQVACQGSGASLWWPNKDHLSDEPDSALISVIVPDIVQNISNGRLRRKIALPAGRTLTEWFVSYPINNYNITFNIGDYTHFSDTYGALTLDYYCLPEHLDQARRLASKVKPMLAQYEKYFGSYPFQRDGFKLIETLYPMEHQSAVALGNFDVDSNELERLMWHEVAHEWWGNKVSMKDFADFWLHEGFAIYSEKLMISVNRGAEAALKSIAGERPVNREPVIGEYDVNHVFYDLDDVYAKGCRLIHTLRSVLNNDSLFFDILRGIQKDFAYQTVSSKDVETYISKKTGLDLLPFFEQYLRTTKIPELVWSLKGSELSYKWNNVVPGFKMPVTVMLESGKHQRINPTADWQHMVKKGEELKEIEVDTANFYISVKRE